MATKNDPGMFDCYNRALPDEPMFVLLARDPEFANLVKEWADRRQSAIRCGIRPESEWTMVAEAYGLAREGETWRKQNNGKWHI